MSDSAPQAPSIDQSLRPLSVWFIVLALVTAIVVSIPLTWWLYHIAGTDPGRQIDAIRTGLTTAAGTGGVFALLLAFHRQRTTERIAESVRLASKRDHDQRDRVAAQTEQDALSRRIGDQYTSAAEQLGNANAPVRLAGLYALERIGEANESERQAVVSLICAYLRMPFQPPAKASPALLEGNDLIEDARRAEELEVRRTAQEILAHRTRVSYRGSDEKYWPGMNLDLSRATLVGFSLVDCRVNNLYMVDSGLYGPTAFASVRVDGRLLVRKCEFWELAAFRDFRLGSIAAITDCEFHGPADFDRVAFSELANFHHNTFDDSVSVEVLTRSINSPNLNYRSAWPADCTVGPYPPDSAKWILITNTDSNKESNRERFDKWWKKVEEEFP